MAEPTTISPTKAKPASSVGSVRTKSAPAPTTHKPGALRIRLSMKADHLDINTFVIAGENQLVDAATLESNKMIARRAASLQREILRFLTASGDFSFLDEGSPMRGLNAGIELKPKDELQDKNPEQIALAMISEGFAVKKIDGKTLDIDLGNMAVPELPGTGKPSKGKA